MPAPAGFVLMPAVDISGGRAVRLQHGDPGGQTSYGDPVQAALAWQAAAAQWVHAVDLDAAFGRGSNAALLAEVVRAVDVAVQLSGGVRDEESLRTALATGCARVNLSTAALADRDWCAVALAEHGERMSVSLDVRGQTLMARGSRQPGGPLFDALEWLDRAGCPRYVVTDVTRDGTLGGPNLALLRTVCERTDSAVIASGGVGSLDDVRDLAALAPRGVEGAILGKALYTGAFTLEEALAAVGGGPGTSSAAAPLDRFGRRARR